MKRRWSVLLVALGLLAAALLTGCQGKPLPEGMDEDSLMAAGQETLELLLAGDYEAVLELFREDVRQELTAETIGSYVEQAEDGAGTFQRVDDSLATGSDDPEPHAIAVFYCKYSKDSVMYRLAFDPDMALIGLHATKQ